jgi:hypothetical protein
MKITSLTIVDEAPHGWEDGDKLLAVFDYQDAGYLFKDAGRGRVAVRSGRRKCPGGIVWVAKP